ncbi:hypothetical protein [Streptomyces zhihengii]|uniref:Uncharacterized protein n=1 Tax=Streptomyces zhihengii TaxID=1818004 RepID=A0ABS2V3T8_9ACTN|nr:hypothetical protein [Streptomyces zhihengii]MBM9624484.1 hypothetical protein [Streptomyces zhihengii]
MTSSAERYREEWAIKTGRRLHDVYVPTSLQDEQTEQAVDLGERRARRRPLTMVARGRIAA